MFSVWVYYTISITATCMCLIQFVKGTVGTSAARCLLLDHTGYIETHVQSCLCRIWNGSGSRDRRRTSAWWAGPGPWIASAEMWSRQTAHQTSRQSRAPRTPCLQCTHAHKGSATPPRDTTWLHKLSTTAWQASVNACTEGPDDTSLSMVPRYDGY